MAKILILIKKSPKQKGFGLLQTIWDGKPLMKTLDTAQQAAFGWAHSVSMDWKFRLINPDDFRFGSQPYYDDDFDYKGYRIGVEHARA